MFRFALLFVACVSSSALGDYNSRGSDNGGELNALEVKAKEGDRFVAHVTLSPILNCMPNELGPMILAGLRAGFSIGTCCSRVYGKNLWILGACWEEHAGRTNLK